MRRLSGGVLIPLLAFAVLLVLPLLPLDRSEGFLLALATRVMIFAIAAVALDLILGGGGLVSFGHAAFMAIGAYAVAILDANGIVDGAVVVPVAMAAGAAFALLTGAISLRTRGVYFIMITLAFAQMVFFIAGSLAQYGGDDGYTLYGRTELLGWRPLDGRRGLYWSALVLLVATYALCRVLLASRFGRVLRAARENRTRVEALGYAPFRFQLLAYVIAGTMTTLAGVLLANAAEFVSPAYASWQRSGELVVLVILGGVGSVHGAILGAASVVLLEEYLSHMTEHWRMIFGALLVLAVLFFRRGLAGVLRG